MLERNPPFSLEAEEAVLGSILIDSDAIVEIADFLRVEDFYRQSHQIIFRSLMALYGEHQPTDIVMVAERIERDGDLDRVGGRSYLSSLTNATPTAIHVASYAKVVQRKAILRALISAAGKIAGIAYTDPDDIDAAVDEATAEMYQVAENRVYTNKAQPLKTLMLAAFDKIDALYTNRGQVTGIGSGLRDLDVLTQGFQPSDLIIIAARPSVGKTSLALNIAEHAASKEGKSVAIFSLEMNHEQLVMRLLSAAADVDSQRLRSGFLEEMDFARIATAMNTLSTAEMYIDDTPSATIVELRTKARRLKAEVGMDLLIVDYLQLMHAPSSSKESNRVQEVSAISRGLKQLARELSVPVIALSQLSRRPDDREGGEPRLSDLRDSGAIEQDADVVMFLWKKGTPDEEEIAAGGQYVNLKLAKHRNGPTGDVKLWFRNSQTRFYILEERFD